MAGPLSGDGDFGLGQGTCLRAVVEACEVEAGESGWMESQVLLDVFEQT